MALVPVVAGAQAVANDLNQIINLLQGAAGNTETFLLRAAALSDFKVRLSDAAGVRQFIIQNSAGTDICHVDSSGNLVIAGSFTPAGAFILPQSTTPSQTAEGSAAWDTDDDVLTVGTGAATKRLGLTRGAGSNATATAELVYDTTNAVLKVWDGAASQTIGRAMKLVGSSVAATSTTSTSPVDLVTISSLNIPISSWIMVRFTYRKQALSANAVAYGLKVNTTVVVEASFAVYKPHSSANNQAEAGYATILIPPRETANYGFGVSLDFATWTTAGVSTASTVTDTSAASGAPSYMNAVPPQAAITSLAIRAMNNIASNAVEVTTVDVYELVGS